MYIDSHCHLDFPDLLKDTTTLLANMQANQVEAALCVGVDLNTFPAMLELVSQHTQLYASVGVHPDYTEIEEPTVEQLVALSQHPKVIAIGETGLDFYRLQGDLSWQKKRFAVHIEAAKITKKPLIIHTRSAAFETVEMMKKCRADMIGGVMHCFTENWEIAQAALGLGFYISFSGIVTFKNAHIVKEVARQVPLDRLLIETDAPYLAPIPYRGKINQPAYVKHVAEEIARLKGIDVEMVGRITTQNFKNLFKLNH